MLRGYQVSISSTFYIRLFHTKVLWAPFILLQIGFEFFWPKNIGAKAACKMLMKLNTCVNFTNILQAAFTPEDLR